VLYQLSYIGENPVVSYQPSALANPTLTLPSALLVLTTAVRAHHLFAMHPGLGREQRQDGQRRQANSEIFQCAPRECAESGERRQRDEQPVHSNPFTPNGWCTGKDSNLRTSEEGQIYSLLALTTHPPVQKPDTSGSASPAMPAPGRAREAPCVAAGTRNDRRTEMRAKNPSARTPHLEKFLMECRWKLCYAAPRPMPSVPE
jgi:hypothetical protein